MNNELVIINERNLERIVKNMKALFLNKNDLSVKEMQLYTCDEKYKGFFVSVIASGICGTDLHIIEKDDNRHKVLGHEFYGIITKVSDGICIKSLNGEVGVGDLVTIIPGTVCGECEYCKLLPCIKEKRNKCHCCGY